MKKETRYENFEKLYSKSNNELRGMYIALYVQGIAAVSPSLCFMRCAAEFVSVRLLNIMAF